jgi:hypothetical protein
VGGNREDTNFAATVNELRHMVCGSGVVSREACHVGEESERQSERGSGPKSLCLRVALYLCNCTRALSTCIPMIAPSPRVMEHLGHVMLVKLATETMGGSPLVGTLVAKWKPDMIRSVSQYASLVLPLNLCVASKRSVAIKSGVNPSACQDTPETG